MTVASLIEQAVLNLASHGVSHARANADFLMSAALKIGRGEMLLSAQRTPNTRQRAFFTASIRELCRHKPLAYILGTQNFLGLTIKITPAVLIPRPETEELVWAARKLLKHRMGQPIHIVEIGTGSGCIAIALAKTFPTGLIYATDISTRALQLARINATRNGCRSRIRFVKEDLFKPSSARCRWADLVISNPPYIPSAVIPTLDPEVRKEPYLALDGGVDGLDALNAVIAAAPLRLKAGGFLALEIGSTQGSDVRQILYGAGFSDITVHRDMSGHDRIAIGKMIK